MAYTIVFKPIFANSEPRR